MANAASTARAPVEEAQEGRLGRTLQRAHRRGLAKLVIGITATVAWLPLVGFGCDVNQEFLGSGQPKIQFEGDSITLLATDDINTWFGPGYDVAIDAYWGATT